VESVPGGTVFLDEVGALSVRMQARLLWLLETGKYQRIGDDRVQTRLDVRLIASTTANLPARVAAGLFLDDLYDRLSAVCLSVPPLRERRDDIPSLVDHFAGQFAGQRRPFQSNAPEISSAARDALHHAEWPGNVRQLKSVVLRELLSTAAGGSSRRATLLPFELVKS
jgi:DNA-binding NtrC family response regulator